MTVKELKAVLNQFDDTASVALQINDSYDTFMATEIQMPTMQSLNGLVLEVTLPDRFYIGED